MVSASLKNIFLRLVLPIALFAATIIRPSFVSLGFGILGFLSAVVPSYTDHLAPGSTNTYLILTFGYSTLVTIGQIVAQSLLGFVVTDSEFLSGCNGTDKFSWLRQSGWYKFDADFTADWVRTFLPEPIAFFSSMVVLVICTVLKTVPPGMEQVEDEAETAFNDVPEPVVEHVPPPQPSPSHPTKVGSALKQISDAFVVFMIILAGTIWPSVLSSVYFLTFLALGTWWALFYPVKRSCFNSIKVLLIAYSAVHLVVLYLYQLEFFQQLVEPESIAARMIGLTVIVLTKCPGVWHLEFVQTTQWPVFVNPAFLLLFYFFMVFQYRMTREGGFGRSGTQSSGDESAHEELGLLASGAGRRRTKTPERQGLLGNEEKDETRPEQSGSRVEDEPPHRSQSEATVPPGLESRLRLFSSSQNAFQQKIGQVAVSGVYFIIYHCYALGLITMMLWALFYHSWLSLAFLLGACAIWAVPDSRKAALYTSPIVLAYAECLLIIQYLYCLDLRAGELGFDTGQRYVTLQQIGLFHPDTPCFTLWAKIAFALPFYLTMRMFFRERHLLNNPGESGPRPTYGTFQRSVSLVGEDGGPSFSVSNSFIGSLFAKYWIFVVALILLLVGVLGDRIHLYNVGFMILFGLLIVIMQISFSAFRRSLFVYWTVAVIYSMVVLVALYLYQFTGVDNIWGNWTELNQSITEDIGLVKYESGELILHLIGIIAFLFVAILQLKFFHRPWLRLTDLQRARQVAYEKQQASSHAKKYGEPKKDEHLWDFIQKYVQWMVDFAFSVAELHISKLIGLAFLLLAVYEVSAVNFALVCVVSMVIPFPRLRWIVSFLGTIYLSLLIVAKMVYQMNFIKVADLTGVFDNCSVSETLGGDAKSNFSDTPTWLGFTKVDDISFYLRGYIITLVLLAIHIIILARQKYKRTENGVPTNTPTFLFPAIDRQTADDGLKQCLQYLANYFCYKFGLELSFCMTMLVVFVRMDAWALIYLIIMFFLLLWPRTVLSKTWWIYTTILAILLPLQYALCIGFPPYACIRYPFNFFNGTDLFHPSPTNYPAVQNKNLIMWLFLPDYITNYAPNALFLIADFFQLLVACCQMAVFRTESRFPEGDYPGGDNRIIIVDNDITTQYSNPVKDFVEYTDTFLDMIKYAVFMYGHWVTMVMVFVAGLGGKSLFSLGYLIFAFVFLWKGNDLYLKPLGTVCKKWRWIVYYCVVIVGLKVAVQFVGCVYPDTFKKMDLCFVAQLFSIACLNQRLQFSAPETTADSKCEVSPQETGIGYDFTCFIFLMIQLRLLSSWYFQHCVLEYKVQRILSARGATLINDLMKRQMKRQQVAEAEAFEEIAAKAEKIREKQKTGREFVPQTYAESKRAADYSWFDYDPQLDDDIEDEGETPEVDPHADAGGLDPAQVIHTAVQKDLDPEATLQGIEAAEDKPKDERALAALTADDDEIAPAPPFADDESLRSAEKEGDKEESTSIGDKILGWIKLAGAFLESVLNQIASIANSKSRDYRYVAHVLKVEKSKLKDTKRNELTLPTMSIRDVRRELRTGEIAKQIQAVKSEQDIEIMEQAAQDEWRKKNVIARLCAALGYLFLAQTEIICYMLMILNHMATCTILSMILPLLAFVWGTLCSPRPPKMFWIVVIGYTEAIMLVKYMFQFDFYKWNRDQNTQPFYPPNLLGVKNNDVGPAWDVCLLIVLFFHRYILRTLGLWKDARHTVLSEPAFAPEPSDNNATVETELVHTSGDSLDSHSTHASQKTSKTAPFAAYCGGFGKFYERLFNPTVRYIRDLYPWMFFMDMICFLVAVFGYSSFGSSVGEEGNVVAVIQSNRVPLQFVVLLVVLVMLMVIDRALYLGKSVKCKLAFQYLLVIGVHGWLFFLLPSLTGSFTRKNLVAKIWYVVKGIYFLISAWQIRNGYPRSSIGHMLMKSYSIVSLVLFKVFMLVPFLFELRTLIDWTWTDTSLPLFDYFNMENFFATIFGLKCSRQMEKDFPAPRGVKKGAVVKYAMGLPLVLVVIIIVFGPLLAYSLVNYIGDRKLPNFMSSSIQLEGYPPFYTTEQHDYNSEQEKTLTEKQFNEIGNKFAKSKSVQTFLNDYTYQDVVHLTLPTASMIYWEVTDETWDAIINDTSPEMQLLFSLKLKRPQASPSEETKIQGIDFSMKVSHAKVVAALKKGPGTSLIACSAVPPYLIMPSEGSVIVANSFTNEIATQDKDAHGGSKVRTEDTAKCGGVPESLKRNGYLDLKLTFDYEQDETKTTKKHFWRISLEPPDATVNHYLLETTPALPGANSNTTDIIPDLIIFVDKTFPSILSGFIQGGIIAMYLAVVLVIGSLVRGILTNVPLDVIINEMPNADRLMKLCRDIYLVREAKDFELEQDLFARIIFLFRSPETLIRWTRHRVGGNN